MSAKKDPAGQRENTATLLRDVMNNIPDMIYVKDIKNRFVLSNKAHAATFGLTPEQMVGKSDLDLFPESLSKKYFADDNRLLRTKKPILDKITAAPRPDGGVTYVSTTKVPRFDRKGRVIGSIGVTRNVTERMTAEEQLRLHKEHLERLLKERERLNRRLQQLILKDPQTGLYNHRYLSEVIESELYNAKHYRHALSLILIDIDYFKSINDVYGHEFGDLVLKQVVALIKKLLNRHGIMVRFGGEEFMILSPGMSRRKSLLFAQRIVEAVSLEKFGNNKHKVKLSVSAAVAAYPEDVLARGADMISLADKVLDRAQDEGGNRVCSSPDLKKKRPHLPEVGGGIKFLREKVQKLTKRGNQSLIEAIFAFAKAIEMKDQYTGDHVEKTVYYATHIAKALGLAKRDMELMRQAAVLHDLGKVGISDKILLKRSKLTKKEFNEIKKHPQIGIDILRPLKNMRDIMPYILHHHERWDGRGYPAHLKGEEIPILARIIAIADVYQALTSDRPYRKALSKKEAIEIIKKDCGSRFDPKVVSAFLKVLKHTR